MASGFSDYNIISSTQTPVNSALNIGGSCAEFIDIGTDPSFNSVVGQNGRIGKRYAYPPNLSSQFGYRVRYYGPWAGDISLNYLDLSWNFYIACDNSRNYFQADQIPVGNTARNPVIHIYDISYQGRAYLGDVDASGNPYVPKVYDSSGGSFGAFQNISFLLSYKDNNNGGFTYSPEMYDPAEVLPSSGGGGGSGGGTDPSGGTGGGGTVDPSGGTDSSGNNVADNSQNIAVIDMSLNDWFFNPPKPITNGSMVLDTNLSAGNPGLDCGWTNPTQRRAAFDFLGTTAPPTDISGIGGGQIVDDYNYLPYFQGLKVQFLLFDQAGAVLGSGQSWTDISFTTATTYQNPATPNVSIWEGRDFLPREMNGLAIFNSTAFGGSHPKMYNYLVKKYYITLPPTFGGTSTAGCKVRIRIAMINRARETIPDPSYVEHNTTADVSWNWVYIPEVGALSIGEYGEPTAPLTITIPTTTSTLKYNQFTLSGYNDNSGNDIAVSSANRSEAIVEKDLRTLFDNLDKNNASLPKVQYRYDLSGSRAPGSLQVGGSQAGVSNLNYIDISINIPNCTPADNSLNWIPSNFAGNTLNNDPNAWSSTLSSSAYGDIIYPQHTYKLTNYSMRYSLDPSRNDGTYNDYRDASLNTTIALVQNSWTTPYPKRNECTNTYQDGLSAQPNPLSGSWNLNSATTTWPVGNNGFNQYEVSAGATKAWKTTYSTKTNLLFLNNNTEIEWTGTFNEPLRANGVVTSSGTETFVGIRTSGQNLIRIGSEIFEDGTTTSWSTDLDLSGTQVGFLSAATNPSNTYLEWETDALTNAYGLGDISRNGGYYCGTRLKNIKIKSITLTNYRDVSNNTNERGYKAIIYQELFQDWTTNNVTRYPSGVGNGIWKRFNPALRPTGDITFEHSTATFELKDGYDGGTNYVDASNNFKFGATPGAGQNPTANFFGLPTLRNNSQNIIEYYLKFDDFDPSWWPTDGNCVDLFRFYLRSGNQGTVLPSASQTASTYTPGYHSTKPSGKYILWGGTSDGNHTYPWDGNYNPANNTGGLSSSTFPDLPSSIGGGNDYSTLTGNFDLDNDASSFTSQKYSRDLFDHNTYSLSTPNVANPLFYVDACYDNNILRSNRGKSGVSAPDLEAGNKRTIGEAYSSAGDSSYKNRFEGKGVGPNGQYLLFWDNTLNTGVGLYKVGNTVSSGTYSQYPFVNPGTAPNYATAYDHTLKLSDGTQSLNGGARQLMWAKNAFKPGGWSTASEKPYIDYSGNYWFGDHPSGFSQDYSYLDTVGEQLGSIANTYAPSAADPKWWSINYGNGGDYGADTTWNWDSSLRWKFMVLKVTIPTLSAGTGYGGFRLQYQGSSGSFTSLPTITKAELTGGPGSCDEPVVWWKEVGGTASHPAAQFPASLGGGQSGWKATHKTGIFSSGNNNGYNNSNDSGSMDETIAQRATNTDKIHRLWGFFGTSDGNYDLYFRIGLPNQGSKDIQRIRVQFVTVNGSNAISEHSSQTFNFKQ